MPKIAEPGNRHQDGRSPFSELQGYSLHVLPGTVLCCAEACQVGKEMSDTINLTSA